MWKEGLPYSLLEAMAAGAVPITTREGAIPDVISDGVNGLFVRANAVDEVARAVARLEGDRALLTKLARAARDRVTSDYNIERMAMAFDGVYRSLV